MKRFIKRNVVLVAILAVAVIGTVFMMIYAISGYIEMNNAIRRTEDLGQQIASLSQQKPAPSQENIDIIRHDAALYKKEVAEIQHYFGHPFADALEAFYQKLGLYAQAEAAWKKLHGEDEEPPELTPEVRAELQAQARTAFYDYLKEFWSSHREDALNNASIFRNFRISRVKKPVVANEEAEEDDSGFPYTWTPDAWDAAVDEFAKEAALKSREPINADNREDILFMALGLPRDFGGSPNKAALYIKDVQRRLATAFMENNIFLDESASYFSFIDVVPAKEQITYVAKVASIIDDLGIRIAGPKPPKMEGVEGNAAEAEEEKMPQEPLLTEVWEFERVDLEEQELDMFEVFRFRVKALGSLESIHALVKRLHDAAESDNRFYLVRRMTIQQLNDDARDIMLDAGLINEEDLKDKSSGSSGIGGMGMGPIRPSTPTRKPTATPSRITINPGMPGVPGMPGTATTGTEKQERPKNLRHSQMAKQGGTGGRTMLRSTRATNPNMMMANPMMQNPMMQNMPNMQNYQQNVMTDAEKRYWREQEDRKKPMQERSTYAQPVIGADIDMEVDLVIDYIVLSNKDFEQE